jgi:hypothetical protein
MASQALNYIIMKIKIFYLAAFIIILISSSCENTDTIRYNHKGKVDIDKNITFKVEKLLSELDCDALHLELDGCFSHSDTSYATHYFKPNVKSFSFEDTTENIVHKPVSFAYAYLDKKNIVNVRLYLYPDYLLSLEVAKDTTFTSYYTPRTSYFETEQCSLRLDKFPYQIGDTIQGYTFYQGLEQSLKKRWSKEKYYFRCVIGTSPYPFDYINSYPKCEGIVNESFHGKGRNILAPPIK